MSDRRVVVARVSSGRVEVAGVLRWLASPIGLAACLTCASLAGCSAASSPHHGVPSNNDSSTPKVPKTPGLDRPRARSVPELNDPPDGWLGFTPGRLANVCGPVAAKADDMKAPAINTQLSGLLRTAHCPDDRKQVMTALSRSLGVGCGACHERKKDGGATEYEYATITEEKTVSNWMLDVFVLGLRRADGKPVSCTNCHRDETRSPKQADQNLHLLGQPRSRKATMVWMHEVMSTEFVLADGQRLRCQTCHDADGPGQPGWRDRVIGRTDLRARFKSKAP